MGACSTRFPQTSIMKSSIFYKVLFGHYIPPKTIQITKINKAEYYYKDKMGRKQKKSQKFKSKKGRRFRNAKFRRGCEIWQPLRNCSVFCLPSGLPSGSAALSSN